MAVSGAHQSIGDQNEIYGQEISEELIQARMSKVEQLHSIFMSSQAKFAEMLTNLGWKKDSSQHVTGKEMSSCRINASHTVPTARLLHHERVCAVRSHGAEGANLKDLDYSPAFYYSGCQRVVPVLIDADKLSAICSKAETSASEASVTSHQSQRQPLASRPSDGTAQHNTSLHDSQIWVSSTPAASPMETLRMVFEWMLIPQQFLRANLHSVDGDILKSWIESNLPSSPMLSTVPDGKGQVMEVVMALLTASSTPDQLQGHLKPFLGQDSRNFVLRLWRILVAMGMASSLGLASHHVMLTEAATRQHLASTETKGSAELSEKLSLLSHLPAWLLSSVLTPSQRLAVYQHSTESARDVVRQAEFTAEDLLTAIEKHPGSKAYAEEDKQKAQNLLATLERERDYRRRRQTYRAKNVHITKRSAVEIMRDLIAVGMKEIVADDGEERDDAPTSHSDDRPHQDRHSDRDQSYKSEHRQGNRDQSYKSEYHQGNRDQLYKSEHRHSSTDGLSSQHSPRRSSTSPLDSSRSHQSRHRRHASPAMQSSLRHRNTRSHDERPDYHPDRQRRYGERLDSPLEDTEQRHKGDEDRSRSKRSGYEDSDDDVDNRQSQRQLCEESEKRRRHHHHKHGKKKKRRRSKHGSDIEGVDIEDIKKEEEEHSCIAAATKGGDDDDDEEEGEVV